MGKSKNDQVSGFSLEGRFLGFWMEDGYKVKQLQLATAEGEVYVKASKELRASLLGRSPLPGEWVRVSGEQKLNSKTGELKLKAYSLISVAPSVRTTTPPPSSNTPTPAKPKTTILVCQKSDCRKRGSGGVCQALANALGDRGLTDEVTIKETGCMKHCKAGPNIVFMPDKTRYSQVHPAEISTLVEKHFPVEASIVDGTP